jgi:serine/threonine-protein kinase
MPSLEIVAATLPPEGTVIAGKYALGRQLGQGGMGVVYEATHLRLHQRLAIKILRPEVRDFADVLERFEKEARVTAQLRSIHTARVIDTDTLDSGLPYIVLELLEGRDLEAELQMAGRLPVVEAVDVALQVAEAMQEAHALGIVHRDLKPANLFVCRVGERRVIKVLDFGISRSMDELEPVAHAQVFGTPHYAAPEQLDDASRADPRSDVWSLGVILYELLAGWTPFEGDPEHVIARVLHEPVPWPLRAGLPRELLRVVMAALDRDPAQRWQSMSDFAAALAPFGPRRSAAATVAEVQRGRGRLGEILVAEGLLTSADLERALAEQSRTGKLLGRVLLDLELVAQADLLTALAKQQGIHDVAQPDPVERERRAREASTHYRTPMPRRLSVTTRRTLMLLPLGLLLGVLTAVGAAGALRSHAPPAGAVTVAPP